MRNAFISRPIIAGAAFSAAPLFIALAVLTAAIAVPAHALSDGSLRPQIEDGAPAEDSPIRQAFEGATTPDAPAEPAAEDDQLSQEEAPATGEETPATGAPSAAQTAASDTPTAEIIRDLSTLPEPVRSMRERMVEAAASGDVERLRPLIEGTPKPPQIMNGESDDPIETLKNFSGDAEGQEILAIMLDILATGAARLDTGTAEETYVWPYFTGKSLASLTPPERVELLRIVTAGDLMGMEENGNYNFYRIGISPDGQWKFMAGGD
jgi:hypothetical protein